MTSVPRRSDASSFPRSHTVPVSVPQVKTEEQIAAEQEWFESEKVWLVHKDGFSLGERGRPPHGDHDDHDDLDGRLSTGD